MQPCKYINGHQASSGAAGDHLCQAASTIISRVASMPEQGENNKDPCIASLLNLDNSNLVHHMKAVLRG